MPELVFPPGILRVKTNFAAFTLVPRNAENNIVYAYESLSFEISLFIFRR